MEKIFNFHNAFGETGDEVWGVWVGEHGFLDAVFRNQLDARNYADYLPFNDWCVQEIKLHHDFT